jgi:hypothetical protein
MDVGWRARHTLPVPGVPASGAVHPGSSGRQLGNCAGSFLTSALQSLSCVQRQKPFAQFLP